MNSRTNVKAIKSIKSYALFSLTLFLCLLFPAVGMPKTIERIDRPEGIYVYGEQTVRSPNGEKLDGYVDKILENYHPQAFYRMLTIAYPFNESIFPPEIAAPTFKWIEKESDIRYWLVMVTFGGRQKPLYILCNKPQWTPVKEIWELMKQNSVQDPAQITIIGVKGHPLSEVVSKGNVKISTSLDPVGAPIMFRRVPPSFAFASQHPELMEWSLADISSYEAPPVIMSKQPICGSCHTFSKDGRSHKSAVLT